MTPGVSAGSNHVGARETCTANVSCPSGAAAAGATIGGRIATVSASSRARGSEERRVLTRSSNVAID
jgi:hypothetical protein